MNNYFVAYFFTSNDGAQGWANSSLSIDYALDNIDNVNKLALFICSESDFKTCIITSWKLFETPAAGFDLLTHLKRQHAFSIKTFGPGYRDEGIVDHIRKELKEILAAPGDLEEWIDVVILALDGAQRNGHSPAAIIEALVAKQEKNEGRDWPDWRTAEPGKAIEHVRGAPIICSSCHVHPAERDGECVDCSH